VDCFFTFLGEVMNIIELAKQAEFSDREIQISHDNFARFAALVAAAARADEREECAKLAAKTVCDVHLPTGTKIYGSRVATAIRARGTT
jgi:hypothetical protein